MKTIRVSVKLVRQIMGWLGGSPESDAIYTKLNELLKPKRSLAPARKRKAAKRLTKKEETSAIREAVRFRAEGGCELCPGLGMELHHALGRVRAKQALENCLWLCRSCHDAITHNRPSAAYWLDAQARRFHELGCRETLRILEARLDAIRLKAKAQEVMSEIGR